MRRAEGGSALVEVTWLSILLLVPLLYVVVAVFEVQRAAFAATGAARAAGRAYTTAPTEASAPGRAAAAIRLSFEDHGSEPTEQQTTVTCAPDPANCLAPGSVVTVRVMAAVRLPLVPDALGGHAPRVRVEAVHRVPYGSFREDRA